MRSQLEILEALEKGELSAQQALDLINKNDSPEEETIEVSVDGEPVPGRKIHIRIYDPEEGKNINVKVPIALLKFGLRITGMFSKELKQTVGDKKVETLIRMAMDEIRRSGPQTLVDIESGDGTLVKISVL